MRHCIKYLMLSVLFAAVFVVAAMDLHLIFTLVSLVISSCVFFYFLKQLITGSNEPSTEGSEADQVLGNKMRD